MNKDKLVVKTMHLAYLVDRHTEYCTFIRWAGHVQSLEIEIRESCEKWRNTVLCGTLLAAYREARDENDPVTANLLAKIAVLEKILQDEEIPYTELDYEDIVTREYFF